MSRRPGLGDLDVGSPLDPSDPQGRFTKASRPFFGMSKALTRRNKPKLVWDCVHLGEPRFDYAFG
ncbi:hypothetical protein Poly41_48910 [Novipirellula artificiosorum]|uniref:Uncharacterized protein n=1 Tax=Novipirellula artificiosorum TaxID=2528016 RepID=A0A5C6DDV7_9BACT|nr:hypothetical protein Poly41_48910 [Novipirellula artificiosorum]